MLYRSYGKQLFESISSDAGMTWSFPQKIELPVIGAKKNRGLGLIVVGGTDVTAQTGALFSGGAFSRLLGKAFAFLRYCDHSQQSENENDPQQKRKSPLHFFHPQPFSQSALVIIDDKADSCTSKNAARRHLANGGGYDKII